MISFSAWSQVRYYGRTLVRVALRRRSGFKSDGHKTSGLWSNRQKRSAWSFDHKPRVLSRQSWHLITFSQSQARVFFRLWTHLCIIHKEHCDLWKRLNTRPQTFWSHSINTNENNHSRVVTVFGIAGVCVFETSASNHCSGPWRRGMMHVTVIKPWVIVSSIVWNQSQCFVIMPSALI